MEVFIIKVINEVEIFANKDSHDPVHDQSLMIVSHPSDDTMIVIVINSKEYKVVAKDLQSAVTNAVNCARH